MSNRVSENENRQETVVRTDLLKYTEEKCAQQIAMFLVIFRFIKWFKSVCVTGDEDVNQVFPLMLHVCVLRQCVCELWVWIPVCQQVTEVRLVVVEGVSTVVCERIVIVHVCVSI